MNPWITFILGLFLGALLGALVGIFMVCRYFGRENAPTDSSPQN